MLLSHKASHQKFEGHWSGGIVDGVRHYHHRPTVGTVELMWDWWHYPDIYSPDEIKNINNVLQRNLLDGEDNLAKGIVKTSAVRFVQWGAVNDILANAADCIYHANRVNFSYDIHPLDRRQVLNFNCYRKGQEYAWHQDKIVDPNRIIDIKLTFIINLSEVPYTGGDFHIAHKPDGDNGKIEFNPGTVVVFSGGLFHKVSPVIEGTRLSLTTWIEGPRWR